LKNKQKQWLSNQNCGWIWRLYYSQMDDKLGFCKCVVQEVSTTLVPMAKYSNG
jgi:hypothetical protein